MTRAIADATFVNMRGMEPQAPIDTALDQPQVGCCSSKQRGGLASGRPSLARSELDDLVRRYEREAHAQRTRENYRSDWALFERWCDARCEVALPASVDTLCRYLAHLADGLGRKVSTIRRARCSIGLAHAYAGLARPDQHARVHALERGISRLHGAREQGAVPLLHEDLVRLAGGFGDSPRDVRDRALILLGFAGAYRASELAALDVDGLLFGVDCVRVHLGRSKEDQCGHGAYTDIPVGTRAETCPVAALRAWLGRTSAVSGPLFRSIAGERIAAARISTRCVTRAVQRAAGRAGLVGHYSSHSLRSGLATSAYVSGATEREIQAHGRWKDRRSLDRYIHVQRVPGRKNVAEGLL